MSTQAPERINPALHQMYAQLVATGASWTKPVAYLVDQAKTKAAQYHQLGTAYADLQPGNMSAYKVILHDLVRPAALVLAAQSEDHSVGLDAYRVAAYGKSMAAHVGGELLVSLPDNFGGRSIAVGLPSHVTPDYVGEVLGCGLNDATALAIFLTAFSDALDELRAGVATGAENHNQPHVFDPDPHLLGLYCKQCTLPAKNARHIDAEPAKAKASEPAKAKASKADLKKEPAKG